MEKKILKKHTRVLPDGSFAVRNALIAVWKYNLTIHELLEIVKKLETLVKLGELIYVSDLKNE